MGGDEFVVLSEDLGPNPDQATMAATALARRVLAGMREDIQVAGESNVIGAAIGVLVTRGTDASPVGLLAEADAAMYSAKTNHEDLSIVGP